VLICYFTRRKLGAYLDGVLDAGAARSTGAHLAGCTACQAEADELRRLRRLLQSHVRAAEPDWSGFWPGIVRGIRDARIERPVAAGDPNRWRPRWAVGGALAAGLLVSAGVWQWALGPVESEAGISVSHARTDDPRGSVMVYTSPERDVAVVWVFDVD